MLKKRATRTPCRSAPTRDDAARSSTTSAASSTGLSSGATQGAATAAGDGTWNYTATTNLPAGQTVSIVVTATDLPGHKTTKSQTKS